MQKGAIRVVNRSKIGRLAHTLVVEGVDILIKQHTQVKECFQNPDKRERRKGRKATNRRKAICGQ